MTASDEFRGAPLGDLRLSRRLEQMGDALARDPDASFPEAMGSAAELEATYRFLSNPRVLPAEILAPHVEATAARARQRVDPSVVHDSTDFTFSGESGEALGFIPTTGKRGFVGHLALAVSDDGAALGVLGLETLFFETRVRGVVRRNRTAANARYRRDDHEKASLRWDRMVAVTRERVGRGAVHVMDREADNYRLLAEMVSHGDRFVVRLRHARRPTRASETDEWRPTSEVVKLAAFVCEREVPLSQRRRRPKLNATHGPREPRVAKLRISATRATIKKPKKFYPTGPDSLTLNIVHIQEVDTPPDAEPVEWTLVTTEPIETRQQVEQVVDRYRTRWVVEEFFRALKTGCAYERRQLESRDALLRTLSLLIPIAWQLLQLRDAARRAPDEPAMQVLRPSQLRVLAAMPRAKLSAAPTLREVFLTIAAQGGHLRRNGEPGWQTLGRGLEKLWWAELGYRAALEDSAAM